MTKRILSIGVATAIAGAMFIGLEGFAPPGAVGQWWPAGTMAGPRDGSSSVLLRGTSTLLPGDPLPGVLVTGGRDASGPVDSVEIFGSNGFVAAAPMPAPRAGHVAVVLEDGRVLVIGGETSSGATDVAELYDPASNTWSSAGSMSALRVNHTASLLRDGRVLVAGGDYAGSASASVEIFDPATGEFVPGPPLSTPRTDHAAAVLGDGRVLIAGGSDGAQAVDTADLYDASTGEVTTVALLAARRAHSATTLLDGRVLIAGGNDGTDDLASAEIFNPASGASTATGGLPAPRSGHVALLLPYNNQVLIAGGTSSGQATAATALYRSWTGGGEFVATGPLAASRVGATASPLANEGWAIVAGGSGLATAETYAFATVKTSKDDYVPGEIVDMSGSGWRPGETISLTLSELPAEHEPRTFTVVADESGRFEYEGFRPERHHAGVQFYLTALGQSSALRARATFWDSIAQEDFGSNSNGDGTMASQRLTIDAPEIVAGEIGIAQIVVNKDLIKNGGVICPPADWTSILRTDRQGVYVQETFRRTAASAATSHEWTFRSGGCSGALMSGFGASGGVVVFSGVDSSNPIRSAVGADGPSSAPPTKAAPGSGAAVAGDMVLRFIGNEKNENIGPNAKPPQIYVQRFNKPVERAAAAFAALHPTGGGSTAGAFAFTGSSGEWTAQTVVLRMASTAAGPSKLAFTTAAHTGTVNQCLGSITVQTQNASGAATSVTSNTTVNLATGGAGTFYNDPACATSVTSPTIASGSNSMTFYYKATARGDGTHQLTASATGLTSATQTQTIDKADQLITFTSTEPSGALVGGTYMATATGGGSGNAVILAASGACSYDDDANEVTLDSAGTCTLTADQAGNDDYNTAPQVTQEFSVGKATATLTLSNLQHTYDGTAKSATVTSNPSGLTGISVTYNGSATAPTAAGSYAVVASLANANYEAADATGTLVIAKATTLTTVTCGGGPFTYNGAPQTPCAAAVTGAGGLSQVLTVNYTNNVNAGTATASATYSETANHLASTDSKTFVIAKAATLTSVTCGAGPFTYSGAPQTPCAAAVTGAGGLNQLLTVSYTDNVNAGTATASATYAETANHLGSTDSETFVIAKAASLTSVTCGAGPFTYNGASQTPCAAAVTGAGGLNQLLTVSYTDNANAGTATASATYAETANYLGSTDSETFVITKAATVTTVTCGPGPFTYIGAAQTPCAAAVTGAGGLNQVLTVNYTNNVNAGAATASAAYAESGNHLGSADSKTFQIAKATATVNVTGTTVTYTGTPHGATGTATGVNNENLGSLLNLGASFTNVPGGAANWTFNAGGTNGNYNAANGSVAIVINKAPLTVTAFASPLVVQYPNVPSFSRMVSGFVNGETDSVLSGTLAFQVFAGSVPVTPVALPPGLYSVLPAGLSAANYTIYFVASGFEVTNPAPVITSVTGSDPVALGSASWLKVKFDDPGVSGDAYTLETTWTDANGNPVIPNGTATLDSYAPPQGQFTYNVTLPSSVYTITVLVKDKFGAVSSPYVFRYIVVFDPSGSFVTGGGWIDSPLGACLLTAECEGAIGRANFGFVSKYHRGKNNVDELTGQTQFQFQAGNLNFHSTAYEWLVVAGAKAQYKGTGMLNGVGGYQFILTGVDGQVNGSGPDRFRIKITRNGEVVYDNQAGEDITELIEDGTLVQGSIVIHEVKRK